ncbi:MAG: oxidoreductase [Candidatus Adlerbacteria bacterium]|nr:oxidoreductase [Candidatus Adlerbacteria bacterium]
MKSEYVLPITIVIAGLLIAGAVFLTGKGSVNPTTSGDTATQLAQKAPPVTAADHILGNPNAPIKVVEYMDLECPHCKVFNTTMHQVMDFYGQSGKVAWVQRPLPLAQIHSKAPKEAEAAECAAEIGGNTAYWAFTDKVFEVTPSENGLDLAQLPVIAGQIGLDTAKFNTCLNSGKHAAGIQQSYTDAIAAGAQGTPFILISFNGGVIPLEGNQPYDSMRAAIDAALAQVPASATASTTAQ